MSCRSFSDHGAMLSQGPRTKVWTWPCFSGAAVVFGRTWRRPGQCIHIFIYIYVYGYVYVYMYICIYVYMYICIYVYMYRCIYVYMYRCIDV